MVLDRAEIIRTERDLIMLVYDRAEMNTYNFPIKFKKNNIMIPPHNLQITIYMYSYKQKHSL